MYLEYDLKHTFSTNLGLATFSSPNKNVNLYFMGLLASNTLTQR